MPLSQPSPRQSRLVALVAVAVIFAGGRAGAEPSPEAIAFFEAKIRPVLAAHCYQCHSAEAVRAGKLKAQNCAICFQISRPVVT